MNLSYSSIIAGGFYVFFVVWLLSPILKRIKYVAHEHQYELVLVRFSTRTTINPDGITYSTPYYAYSCKCGHYMILTGNDSLEGNSEQCKGTVTKCHRNFLDDKITTVFGEK